MRSIYWVCRYKRIDPFLTERHGGNRKGRAPVFMTGAFPCRKSKETINRHPMHERLRQLHLSGEIGQEQDLQLFVEKICDDFNVFNLYYGNMIAAVNEAYNLFREKANDGNAKLDIYFYFAYGGHVFGFDAGSVFLDLAAMFQTPESELMSKESLTAAERSVLACSLLSDEIKIKNEEDRIELVFYVSSINQQLAEERIKILEQYFDIVSRETKAVK